jgi:hypothetical protein
MKQANKNDDTRIATDDGAVRLAYEQMSKDEEREAEALEWAEAIIGDIADEPGEGY